MPTGGYESTAVSLSSDGSIVAIGSTGWWGSETDRSNVRIYENINNTCTQIGSDINGEANRDRLGFSVSLSADGSVVAVEAPDEYFGGSGEGHNGFAAIYQNINNNWTQVASNIMGVSGWDYFGYSVSLSDDGSSVAIGADRHNGNGRGSGHAQIYQITHSTGTTLSDLEAYHYIASNNDLISAFGINIEAAKSHYTNYGKSEGRSLTAFSAIDYLAKYSDLSSAFGNDQILAAKHYVESGFNEGRVF